MSRIEATRQEIVDFILKSRSRQHIADAAGVHLNTVSGLASGKRCNCRVKTLIKLETAINEIKRARKDRWIYRG